jgi:hypothetical protein
MRNTTSVRSARWVLGVALLAAASACAVSSPSPPPGSTDPVSSGDDAGAGTGSDAATTETQAGIYSGDYTLPSYGAGGTLLLDVKTDGAVSITLVSSKNISAGTGTGQVDETGSFSGQVLDTADMYVDETVIFTGTIVLAGQQWTASGTIKNNGMEVGSWSAAKK